MGSVKLLGGSYGCVNVVALMPCKLFVLFCGCFSGCEVLGGFFFFFFSYIVY